ncbi:MAG: helix-turn-helix transcriptional regulator [Deltaproteobacteria bacterium]|nr:helix-turn-helix transcriptional regulator [Deltaproteobacteria bacterium]
MSTKKRRGSKSESMSFLESLAGEEFSFAALLKSIRKGEGLSQVEFAELLGISRSHLCDIEKGRKAVSPARAAQFANVLEYSPEQFVRIVLQEQLDNAGLKIKVELRAA